MLDGADRVAVLTFDTSIECFGDGTLVSADDRTRYGAIEFLARTEARGGTEMAAAMQHADDDLLADITPFRQADGAVLDAGLQRDRVFRHVD